MEEVGDVISCGGGIGGRDDCTKGEKREVKDGDVGGIWGQYKGSVAFGEAKDVVEVRRKGL